MFAWEDIKSYVRMHMPGVFKAAKEYSGGKYVRAQIRTG